MTSIARAIRAALEASDPRDKVRRARRIAREWRQGRLSHDFDVAMPERPGRPAEPVLLPANRMPRRGRGGSERGRIALIHALAHIEFVAIDLALDMAGRFGAEQPRAFVDDWMRVAADEAMHFALLDRRLAALGSRYGAMAAHDGLWDSARDTAHDAMARMAVVPMVLEARGLDVTPATIARFEEAGDASTARILRRILNDEIRHVETGRIWFESSCRDVGADPHDRWKSLVAQHFRGRIKPPFNDSARESAGLTRAYWGSLAAGDSARH